MKFDEALNLLFLESEKDYDSRSFFGIQCENWKKHITNKSICITGVDRVDMFGSCLFDFILGRVIYSWSVHMPCWDEVFNQEWSLTPFNYIENQHNLIPYNLIKYSDSFAIKVDSDDLEYHAFLLNFGHKFNKNSFFYNLDKFVETTEEDRKLILNQLEKHDCLAK